MNINKYIFTFFIAFLLGNLRANCQELKLSLVEALNTAMDNNPELQNMRIDENSAEATVKETIARGLPQISAGLNMTASPQVQVTPAINDEFAPLPPGTPREIIELQFGRPIFGTANIQLNQLVFDGTFFLGLKAAKEYTDFSQLQTNQKALDIQYQIAENYGSLALIEANITVLKESQINLEKLYDETKALYDAGFTEKQEADRIQLSLKELAIQLESLLISRDYLINVLKSQMNLGVDKNLSISENIETLCETALNIQNIPFEKEQLSEIKILEKSKALQELDLQTTKSEIYPKVFLNATHNQQTYWFNDEEFNDLFLSRWFPGTNISLSINWNIFNGNGRKHTAIKKQNEILKTENNINNIAQLKQYQFNQAQSTYKNKTTTINLQKQGLQLAQDIYNTELEKFKAGLGSSFSLIEAQNDMISKKNALMQAKYDLFIAYNNILKSNGQSFLTNQ